MGIHALGVFFITCDRLILTRLREIHGSNERLTSGFVVFVLHVPVLSIASGLARFESRRFRRL